MNEWLDKSLSPGEKRWVSKLQILKKNYVKVALALAFFGGAWWYEDSWIVAITLLVAIYGHELGHLWAMRSVGMGSLGTWFIPFFGGIAVPANDSGANNWKRWLVAVMGPLWGFVMALVPFLIYRHALENHLRDQFFKVAIADSGPVASFAISWTKVTRDIAILNLFNLLPLPLLDGGRMISEMLLSFRRKTGTILFTIFLGFAGWMLVGLGSVWLGVLSSLGVIVLWLRWQKRVPNEEMCGAEVLIAALFHLGLLFGLFIVLSNMHNETRYWEQKLQQVTNYR